MNSYPVQLDIAPPAPQSRLTVFFRILMVIPHAIVLYLVGIAAAVVMLIAWFAIIILGKYPAGMFNFSVGVARWQARVGAYALLLTGVFPPFSLEDSDTYPIRLTVADATTGRNRLTTFFRIFMIIPQIIVLYFVAFVTEILLFVAWFAALFTGRVPEGMHGFIAGFHRWSTRLGAYANLLTDDYPPFSMQ
jgi:Domain of unknown function (DUF4389)